MDIYRYNLNTYKYPPRDQCTISELEIIGTERLQLYSIMNNATNLALTPNSEKWDNYVESKIIKNKLRTHSLLLKNKETSIGLLRARRWDHIAHWLLSLCYCQSTALKYLFMCHELSWFIMLYKRMKKEDLNDFLSENKFNYTEVGLEEKNLLKNSLYSSRDIKDTIDSTIYYKCKFTEVTSLIRQRQVFLYKGFAYFPDKGIIFCVKNELWRQFNQQLTWTYKMIPTCMTEDRIQDFLKNIQIIKPTRYVNDTMPKINVDNIDEIAEKHFPLCMEVIHRELRKKHHLKYDCKMQYGIFLKCLGLAYEDAMIFWKREFTQIMTINWYERKYSYLFKHQYGKVGGMFDYKPYSCKKIQDMSPGPAQHHGCPFKHWDMNNLLDKCQSNGLNPRDTLDIKNLVSEGKFNDACTVYFCGKYKTIKDTVIESPNQYFTESYEMEDALDGYFDVLENCENEYYDNMFC